MTFDDRFVSREYWYSLGLEVETGRYYLSIPVSSGHVDYEEFYEIDQAAFDRFREEPSAGGEFAEACRRREMDRVLFYPPWVVDRGTGV
ncbi:hypothetical protein [Nocardia sp. NBC_00511]|uniref:hypothetical protein n=1 Tax=Nocardia sp. NBC_00511 TaxID=2903591 RepID=UPI0030E03214